MLQSGLQLIGAGPSVQQRALLGRLYLLPQNVLHALLLSCWLLGSIAQLGCQRPPPVQGLPVQQHFLGWLCLTPQARLLTQLLADLPSCVGGFLG